MSDKEINKYPTEEEAKKYIEYLNNLTGKEFASQIKFESEKSHE